MNIIKRKRYGLKNAVILSFIEGRSVNIIVVACDTHQGERTKREHHKKKTVWFKKCFHPEFIEGRSVSIIKRKRNQ